MSFDQAAVIREREAREQAQIIPFPRQPYELTSNELHRVEHIIDSDKAKLWLLSVANWNEFSAEQVRQFIDRVERIGVVRKVSYGGT